jgi:anti-sigma regulatory factor (Ser/Thr protein kinase)
MEPLRRSLPRDVGAVRRARDEVRAALADSGRSDMHIDTAVYVAAELVTEAVEHGAGTVVALVVTVDAASTRIEVTDGLSLAGRAPRERKRTVDALATAAGITDVSGGRTLWAELPV